MRDFGAALLALGLLSAGGFAPNVHADEGVDLGALAAEEEEDDEDAAAEGSAKGEAEDAPSSFSLVEQMDAGSGVRVKTICTNCNSASLSVNGLSGHHVEVTLDGVPMPGGLATVYQLTQFPSDLIGYSHVVRGPGSVLTGPEAVGGAIELHTAKRDRRRAYLDLQLGSWNTTSLKAAGGDRWGPVGALVFLQATGADAVDDTGDGFNEVPEFDRYSAHGLFDFHLSDRDVLTLGGQYYSEDQWEGPGGSYDGTVDYLQEDVFFDRREASLRWDREMPSGLQLHAVARWSNRTHQQWVPTRIPDPPSIRTFDIDDTQRFVEFQAARPIGLAGFLTVGAGWDDLELVIEQINDFRQPFYIVDGLENVGAWAQYDHTFGAKLDGTFGLRYDVFGVRGWALRQGFSDPEPVELDSPTTWTSWLSPRAEIHFRPSERVVLGLAAGRSVSGPAPVFEETCCGAKYQRNIGLDVERGWSYQAMAEFHPTPDMRLTATLFRSDFTNFHEKVVYRAQAAIPYYAKRNLPSVNIEGFDLVHDMRFAGNLFNVGWTFTYVNAHVGEDLVRSFTLPGGEMVTTTLDEAGSRLRYVPRTAASAYFRYDDQKRGTTVSVDLTYQGELVHYSVANRQEWEPWAFRTSSDYWTLDVEAEQRIGRKGWSIYGGIQNVGDYVQEDITTRDLDGSGKPDQLERIYDWGPITGTYAYAGFRFVR